MSEEPGWFAQKRFGYGAGLPIAWQGWAIVGLFTAAIIVAAFAFARSPLALAAVVLPLTAILILIAARTTRGGWHWRWGQSE